MADEQNSGYSSTVTPIEIPRQVSNELQQPTASSPDLWKNDCWVLQPLH